MFPFTGHQALAHLGRGNNNMNHVAVSRIGGQVAGGTIAIVQDENVGVPTAENGTGVVTRSKQYVPHPLQAQQQHHVQHLQQSSQMNNQATRKFGEEISRSNSVNAASTGAGTIAYPTTSLNQQPLIESVFRKNRRDEPSNVSELGHNQKRMASEDAFVQQQEQQQQPSSSFSMPVSPWNEAQRSYAAHSVSSPAVPMSIIKKTEQMQEESFEVSQFHQSDFNGMAHEQSSSYLSSSTDSSIINSRSSVDNINEGNISNNSSHSSASSNESLAIVDIFAADRLDAQLVGEYADDAYNHLREREVSVAAIPAYMSRQGDINPSMRAILIDWLVDVAEEYNLQAETLYLTVIYIDRFLSHMAVTRNKLQLVGITCMLIASKYEEMYPPRIEDFVYIADSTYTPDQIRRMEHVIWKTLDYDVSAPTFKAFLDRYIKAANCNEAAANFARYLAEITMLDDHFLNYSSSIISASSMYLALWCTSNNDECWTSTLEYYTGYTLSDLCACIIDIFHMATEQRPASTQNRTNQPRGQSNLQETIAGLNAIREKYAQERFFAVSNVSIPHSIPEAILLAQAIARRKEMENEQQRHQAATQLLNPKR